MRFLKLRMRNFCQFRDRTVELSPGMNLLGGPNGAGKSNCLKAISGCLLGDFRNAGVKSDNVTFGAGAKDPSTVTLWFEHRGEVYEIQRNLRGGGQYLAKPDGSKVTRDAEISSELSKILGVNSRILEDYVFVDQWKMFDFLESTEARRAEAFSKLFGTDGMEKVYRLVGEFQRNVSADVTVENLAEAESRAVDAATEEAVAKASMAGLEEYLERHREANEQAKVVVSAAERLPELSQRLAALSEKASHAELAVGSIESELAQASVDEETLQRAAVQFRQPAQQADEVCRRWSSIQQKNRERDKLEREIRVVDLNLMEKEPDQPVGYVSDLDAVFHARLDELRSIIDAGRKFLSVYQSGGECPTCGTPVDKLCQDPEKVKAEMAAALAEQKSAQDRLTASKGFDRRLADYLKFMADNRDRKVRLESHVASLVLDAPPNLSLEEAEKTRAEYRSLEADFAQAQRHRAERQTACSVAKNGLHQLKVQYDQCLREYHWSASVATSPEEVDKAVRLKAEYADAVNRYHFVRGQAESSSKVRAAADYAVEKFRASRGRFTKESSWQSRLSRIREVLHWGALPRMISNNKLSGLMAGTNSVLDNFGSPFSVTASEDLSLTAHFPDGNVQSAARLSGGEKMVLAVAFRLKVNLEFAREVGALCLDEPTVGLNAHNIAGLRKALEWLREFSAAQGLQVLVITHEPSLSPFFDKVVDLSNLGGPENDEDTEGSAGH